MNKRKKNSPLSLKDIKGVEKGYKTNEQQQLNRKDYKNLSIPQTPQDTQMVVD